MKVGDLVRHTRWKEAGIVVEEVDVGCPLWGTPREDDVFKVRAMTPASLWGLSALSNYHWRRCDVEVLSASR